jgi:dephospho-CoA kinase
VRSTRRVALTGGIATGKSHCLAIFAELGAPVIDADVLAREAVAPGTEGLAAISARFGPTVIQQDGTVDRGSLGKLIFADEKARRDLEAIIHPIVYARVAQWFDDLSTRGDRLGIADIPLLFESDHQADFDIVIVAACPPAQQLKRLLLRRMSEEEARRRIAAQLPIATKQGAADHVIDTSGTLANTDRQIVDIWNRMIR